MKRLFLILYILLVSVLGNAQNAKQLQNGNYTSISTNKNSVPDKNTGKTFTTSKGEVFPVYISKNGKLYIIRTSKQSGKEYKQYLKI